MLTAEALAVFRGERLVFRDLSFRLPRGGALVLAGPNGSGKSTLLRLLAGLVQPVAGQLLWDGRNALADPAAHGRRVAYVGHLDAVKPGLTVAENLRFAARVTGRPVAEALDVLALRGLADLPARMLSAGQKRRLALSRLALSAAPLWLLDEPTIGLDTASIAAFGAMLRRHLADGGMVVAATHVPLPLDHADRLPLGEARGDAKANGTAGNGAVGNGAVGNGAAGSDAAGDGTMGGASGEPFAGAA
ncbi:heme ABC exporter ATP-binding protein CcmA [Rhodopila sp.]|jgi:heme exporter protein A|uniref:heme ABC exporter ATP-binding protein CcmA n=1 Tax=Rhodopila sp. TaxID=2480087 RepID=UPI0039B761BD